MGFEHSEVTQAVYIVPIAFDLDFQDGEVILGAGTRKACEVAVRHAKQVLAVNQAAGTRHVPVILTTATRAKLKHNHVLMGKMMAEYIRSIAPKEIQIVFHEAPQFNTAGEIAAVQEYLYTADHSKLKPCVIFCAKGWHAPRVSRIAEIASKRSRRPVPYSVESHRLPCTWGSYLKEIAGLLLAGYYLDRACERQTRKPNPAKSVVF